MHPTTVYIYKTPTAYKCITIQAAFNLLLNLDNNVYNSFNILEYQFPILLKIIVYQYIDNRRLRELIFGHLGFKYIIVIKLLAITILCFDTMNW